MKSLKYIIVFIGLFSLQSCFVAKDYTRQTDLISAEHYRTDQISTDSLSIANLPWSEIFTDNTLQGHITHALSNNLDIRSALKSIDIAQAYLKQGKAAYFPRLNGSLGYTGSSPSLNSQQGINLDKRDYFNQFDASVGASWEADIWGKIRSNVRAADAAYLQSVSAHQAVQSNLIAALASTYYQLLALDEQKRVTEETIQNRIQSVETIKALKIAGSVTEAAVQQTEAQVFNARAVLLDIENQIKLLENTFCILLGDEPHPVTRTALNNQTINSELSTGVPVQLLANRPDVMAAEYGVINAFELTNNARSYFYPSLNLTANGGLQSMEFDKFFNASSLFGTILGGLTQPIFNGRQIRTQYEVSQAREELALLNYKNTILNASKEVSDALYSYNTNNEKVNLKQKEYQAYKNAVEASEELLNYGMANYLEVLTAREAMFGSQLAIINTELGRLNAMVQLYRALGGGWR